MKAQMSEEKNVDQELEQFWDDFRLFPLKIERLLFEHFFSLVGISVFPYVIMAIGVLIAHFFYDMDWNWVFDKLTDWQMIIIVIGLLLITPFYLRWQSKIPETFQWLLNSGRIIGDKEAQRKYLEFLAEYQRMLLHRPLRFSFSVLFCTFVIVFNLANPYFLDFIRNGLHMEAMIAIIKRVFGLLFWGYLSGLVVWPVFATSNHIYKLSKSFEFNVHARHPDMCGGLKPLGDFCFAMTLPIVINGVILILLGFSGIAPFDISFLNSQLSGTGEDTVVFANVLLFVFFLPITIATFFQPLWNVHIGMERQKINQEDEFSNEVMRLEEQLRNSVKREEGWEIAKVAQEKIEVLQVVNPQKTGFPVWPFRFNLVLSLLSPQILGVVGTLISLFDFFRP